MIISEKLISKRATTILSRFPRHLDLTREDKVFAQVVNSLARELDIKTMQVGQVRKSHRLGQADEMGDLLLLAGLHDLRPIRFDIVRLRHDALNGVATILGDESAAAEDWEDAVTTLRKLLGLADLGDYALDYSLLAEALRKLTGYTSCLDILRYQIKQLIRIHRAGNGSVRSLLEASGAYLHLRVDGISHVGNDYWHIAHCRDLLTLPPKDAAGSAPATTDDWLALEENPFKKTTIVAEEFAHRGKRKILRNGFDPVPVTIAITGIEDRTCYPMLVDTNKGYGLYYAGIVGDGQILELTADGRVLLDGAAADKQAFAFSGAVFAENTGLTKASSTDFAFCNEHGTTPHGQCGVFVTTEPVEEGFSADMPHMGGLSPAITLAVGATNLQFFVRIAHFGTRTTVPPADQGAVESYSAGHCNTSLFALDTTGAGAIDAAALIGFLWQEREAFKVIVWLPSRFASYDLNNESDETTLAQRLRTLLDRHRAAGISLDVQYATDLWQLPYGYITDTDSLQSYKSITAGSRLWNTGSPQPTS
ncbi:MAG: hypothetical protein ABR512_07930 [Desulfopila sp.]